MCGMVLWPVLHTINMDTHLLEDFEVYFQAYRAVNEEYLNRVASVRAHMLLFTHPCTPT